MWEMLLVCPNKTLFKKSQPRAVAAWRRFHFSPLARIPRRANRFYLIEKVKVMYNGGHALTVNALFCGPKSVSIRVLYFGSQPKEKLHTLPLFGP
jgi:hypothetical protein